MKNYLLLTASAVLVLSSCSNNEIVENHDLKTEGPKTMNFQTYVPGATRAILANEATNDSLTDYGFYLWTSQTKLVQGEEQQVEGHMSFAGDDAWEMEGEQLQWSTDLAERVVFYAAYSKYGSRDFSVEDESDFGMCLTGIDATEGDNDYMFASDTASYNDNNGNVTLNFSHILSQVEVRIGGTTAGYNYEVAGVVLTAQSSSIYQIEEKSFISDAETEYTLYNGISDDGDINNPFSIGLLSDYLSQTDVYSKLMVVPGECSLRLKYRSYVESDILPSWSSVGYQGDDNTIDFEVVAGYRNVVNVKLNPETRAMSFTVTLERWNDNENSIDFNL